MVSQQTLLMCDIVLKRYHAVLSEAPNDATALFKEFLVEAIADIDRERNYIFMELERAIREVPASANQVHL